MPTLGPTARDSLYLGGNWSPSGGPLVDVVSPSSEEVIGQVAAATPAEADEAVATARRTFDDSDWRWRHVSERIDIVRRIADELEAGWPNAAELVTAETGTPIAVARGIGAATAAVFRSAADVGESFPFEERRRGYGTMATVLHEPVGVVGAITPSNGPGYLMASKLAPALVAGCTVVVKSALEAPFAAYAVADACEAAGVPAGVVSILPGDVSPGAHLVAHRDVDMIAFTGSDAAGQAIMGAGAATMKRLSLELGGKAAAIVLEDVDLDTLMLSLVPGSTRNSGQACGLLSRILLPRSRYDEFLTEYLSRVAALSMGDPFDEGTQLGPLISSKQRERVESYIEVAKQEGARLALGGGRPAHLARGWYVEQTVFADVDRDMRVAQEEVFGPVVCVIPYDHEDEALAIANDTPFGLSGSVFTADISRGRSIARQLRVGRRNINSFHMDQGIPFGGFKRSGLGREGGVEGLRAYLETASIFGDD